MSAREKAAGVGRFVRDNISNVEPAPASATKPVPAKKPPVVLVLAIGFLMIAVAAFVLAIAVLRG